MLSKGNANVREWAPKAIVTGLLIGMLMGFIDTYGYAVTGYTTSELSPIIAAVLVPPVYRLLFRRKICVVGHIIAIAIASGFSLSTAITSGMYITYTMLNNVGSLRMPSWIYFNGNSLNIKTVSFYLLSTAVSTSGVLIAYAFYKHFTEREKLPFPVGSAAASVIRLSTSLGRRVILPVTVGLVAEFIAFVLSNPSIDPTPMFQGIIPGLAIALSLNVFIFFLALILPLGTSLGVGIGNLMMYLLLTPMFAASGLLVSTPSMGADDLAIAAAPLTASVIIGFLVISVTYYVISSWGLLKSTLRFLWVSKYMINYIIIAIAIMSLPIITLMLLGYVIPFRLAVIMPTYVVLQFFLSLVTARVVGEAGTASQSTLPISTLILYSCGARGVLPYALLDPYTGVPMPQFITGSSMNVMRMSKSAGTEVGLPAFILALSMLVGAPITLIYGFGLLKIFGLNSPKLNLLRWVPVVIWMKGIYSGAATSFNVYAIVAGVVISLALITITRLTGLTGISLFAVLIGLTLTPDLGLLFLIASAIKYAALRMGTNVYESLLHYSSLALAGAGIGIALSTILSLVGVI